MSTTQQKKKKNLDQGMMMMIVPIITVMIGVTETKGKMMTTGEIETDITIEVETLIEEKEIKVDETLRGTVQEGVITNLGSKMSRELRGKKNHYICYQFLCTPKRLKSLILIIRLKMRVIKQSIIFEIFSICSDTYVVCI